MNTHLKEKYIFPFARDISREIVKSIKQSPAGYSNWMRKFLSPKEFYYFKKSKLFSLSPQHFSALVISKFQINNININAEEFNMVLIHYNRCCLALLLYRTGLLKKYVKCVPNLWSDFLHFFFTSQLKRSKYFSLNDLSYHSQINSDKITIVAPVCPDYSYERKSDGTYRYTFESVGSGIGLVAQKAIINLQNLTQMFQNCPAISSQLSYEIMVGDFEATEDNLSRLRMNKKSFLDNINGSVSRLSQNTNSRASKFTSLCNGLDGWNHHLSYLKHNYYLNCFEDLFRVLPLINHEKNLISRIPLYKKWYGDEKDYKVIFFDQVVEYILMGILVYNKFGDQGYILASDHKAMRPYYSSLSSVIVFGASSSY